MGWFNTKKLCSHCKVTKTHQKFEGEVTCPQCESKILIARETARKCPVDHTVMIKEDHKGIIIDRCTKCHGIWLDHDELEALQELVKKDTDYTTGFILGMAMD